MARYAGRTASTRRIETGTQHVLAYWEAGLYLLTMLIGWTDPGKGLAWLRKNWDWDFLDEPRIRLLTDVWGDGKEEDFCLFEAWCWEHGVGHVSGRLPPAMAAKLQHDRKAADFADQSWFKEFEKRRDFYERKDKSGGGYISNPYTGGTSPLHLGHSVAGAVGRGEPEGLLLAGAPKDARAVLVLEKARGWYEQLELNGRTLPKLGDRSWHVDVFVKPLGWLGTFRKSRVTGLWFQGKHSLHMVGQPD